MRIATSNLASAIAAGTTHLFVPFDPSRVGLWASGWYALRLAGESVALPEWATTASSFSVFNAQQLASAALSVPQVDPKRYSGIDIGMDRLLNSKDEIDVPELPFTDWTAKVGELADMQMVAVGATRDYGNHVQMANIARAPTSPLTPNNDVITTAATEHATRLAAAFSNGCMSVAAQWLLAVHFSL